MNASFSGRGQKARLLAVPVFAALILFLSADDTGIIFVNKTRWPVHIVAGSGRVDVCDIEPFGQAEVKNLPFRNESYYPLYDIALTGAFSLKHLRPAAPDFYFQIDGSRKNQRIEVTAPDSFNDTRAYIIMSNGSKSGGISLSRNDSLNRMSTEEAKTIADAGETAVYAVNPGEIRSFTVHPQNTSSGSMVFRRGFVYHFLFDGASITVLDIRPLAGAGENGWRKSIPGADTALQIVRNNDGIAALASNTGSGIELYTILSGGETTAVSRVKLPDFSVTAAVKTSGGASLIFAGYVQNGAWYTPVLQRLSENGASAAGLEPSRLGDRLSAYFLTLAEDGGGAVLAAGGADSGVNSAGSYQAYVRVVKESAAGFTPLWELGPGDFNAAAQGGAKFGAIFGAIFGEVSAAAFDKAGGVWVIAGKNIEFDAMRNPVTSSYVARIDSNGSILRVNASYKGLLFNRIFIDEAGGCYLAGEEESFNASYAAALKLSPDGTEIWRCRTRPGSDSFYQDGLLDIENGQLVLAGTMGAKDSAGSAGTPFIEGISASTGELLWREPLTDSRFREIALVTGIEKAPLYGFILALSGLKDGYFSPPFMLARLNARGKF
ncbi:MAG: hypothetical protein LBK66_01480 [Spirochaetaceae bacterium]|jgi:hypothetical protein|nr:hypothetical protein [Spirochaetaceae bacterium]